MNIINNHTNDRKESLCIVPMYTLYSPDLYILDVINKYREGLSSTYDISDYDDRSERSKLLNTFTRLDMNILQSLAIQDKVESIEDFLLSAIKDDEYTLPYLADNVVVLDMMNIVNFLSMQKYNTTITIAINTKIENIETAIMDMILQERGIMTYTYSFYENEDELMDILHAHTINMVPDVSIANKLVDKYDMMSTTIMLPRVAWNFEYNENSSAENVDLKYDFSNKAVNKEVELGVVQIFEFKESDMFLG